MSRTRRGATGRRGVGAACSAAAALLLLAVPLQAEDSEPETLSARAAALGEELDQGAWGARVCGLLREARSGPRPSDARTTVAQLAGLGPGAYPAVMLALESRRCAHREAPDEACPRSFEQAELSSLRTVANAARHETLVDFMEAALELEAPLAVRRAALGGLVLSGRADDLDLAVELVSTLDPGSGQAQALCSSLERAVELIALRDRELPGALGSFMDSASTQVLGAMVRGAARSSRPDLVPVLLELADRREDIVTVTLECLRPATRFSRRPLRNGLAERVREHLNSSDPYVARAAISATAAVGDCDAADMLIALLVDERPGVARAAHAALEELFSVHLGSEPERWSNWLERSRAWYDTRMPKLALAMESTRAPEVLATLAELAGKTYQRHEMANIAAVGIDHESASVRAAACATLSSLRVPEALTRLSPLLDDHDPCVRASARRTLESLGVLDLATQPADHCPAVKFSIEIESWS